MTLGVESRSQSQEPRCLRILPCPSLSRLLRAMTPGPPEAGLAARVAAAPRSAWSITQIDGTTLELFKDPLLAEEFGTPSPGAKPLAAPVGLLHSGTRRSKAAVIGRYLDGEMPWPPGCRHAFGPGQLNLADRGFFSMDRFIRSPAPASHLLWRVKTARIRPLQALDVLKRGTGPAARERRHALPSPQDRRRPRPPVPAGHDRAARLLHRADPDPRRPCENRADRTTPWTYPAAKRSALTSDADIAACAVWTVSLSSPSLRARSTLSQVKARLRARPRQHNPQHFPNVRTGPAPFYTTDPHGCTQQSPQHVLVPGWQAADQRAGACARRPGTQDADLAWAWLTSSATAGAGARRTPCRTGGPRTLWGSRTRPPILTRRFYAARPYSLMRPPRTGRRLIRLRERSATGWSGRGGRSWRLR